MREDFRPARRERLRELMERRGAKTLVLRRHRNFAWYTNGADSRVERANDDGVADIVITPDEEFVLAPTIEAPRMRLEQTPELEVYEYPWHEGPERTIAALPGPLFLDAQLEEDIAPLRRNLDPDAVERLRAIGSDASEAMAEAAALVAPGMTEFEAAAGLQQALIDRGLFASVPLAAADERIRQHRHPLPFGARIERRAMLVASADRGGLYANLTRIVDLEEPDDHTSRRVEACEEILHLMREEATRPGRTLAEAFEDCKRFYAEAGFPGEWRLHHQGGLCGYASRELIATQDTEWEIGPGQAFAWNPSIAGAKSEETFVVTEHGPEVVAGARNAGVPGAT